MERGGRKTGRMEGKRDREDEGMEEKDRAGGGIGEDNRADGGMEKSD